MKKILSLLLRVIGYEMNSKDSFLFMHIQTFTNSSWLEDIQNNGNIKYYYSYK